MKYNSAESEQELFDSLVKQPADLVSFFETACDDETWTEEHVNFMKRAMEWLTKAAYEDRLQMQFSYRSSQAIRKHFLILQPIIPLDIQLEFKDAFVKTNSLLMRTTSPFFKRLFIKEFLEKESSILSFIPVNYAQFIPFEFFIFQGFVPHLYKLNQEELIELLRQAVKWEVESIIQQCQKALVKYISLENAVDFLILAHRERWQIFKESCISYLNGLELGFRLYASSLERLGFAFLIFNEKSLYYFQLFCPFITDFNCSDSSSQNPAFIQVVRQCPKLLSLDLSRSSSFTDHFFLIPENLQELNLSECPWVEHLALNKFSRICPSLKILQLCNNTQINYSAWGELLHFGNLSYLDLSGCGQIDNRDLDVILKACKSLTDLSLNGCKNIDEKGFFTLAKQALQLISLTLARTSLSDSALGEILVRCRSLTSIDISDCNHLSEKGILAGIKYAAALKAIYLYRCNVSPKFFESARVIRPYLNVYSH